jgi:hypothetical protein
VFPSAKCPAAIADCHPEEVESSEKRTTPDEGPMQVAGGIYAASSLPPSAHSLKAASGGTAAAVATRASLSENPFDLLQVVKVVPGKHADDVLDGLLATLGVHSIVFPLFGREGFEHCEIPRTQDAKLLQ